MFHRYILRAAVLSACPMLFTTHALGANPILSFEDGTSGGFTQSFNQPPQPSYTNRAVAAFGATDGGLAYGFDAAVGSYTPGDNTFFNFGPQDYVTQADRDRFAAFKAANLLLADITVQGQRLAPAGPSAFVGFHVAFNGPADAGGFKSSENVAFAGFNLDYYTDVRTRTIAWDYVASGYDFRNLNPAAGFDDYTGFNFAQDGQLPTTTRAAFDNVRIYRARASDPTFNGGATASWSAAGTFVNGTPNAPDAVAIFKGRADAAVTVNLTSPQTVGSLVLNNVQRTAAGAPTRDPATAYTFTGSTLTLQVTGTDASLTEASIISVASTNTISAPLNLASNTVIDITADATNGQVQGVPDAPASLVIGNVTLAASKTLRTTSSGTLTINGNLVGGADSALLVNGRKTVLGGTAHRIAVGSLTVSTASQLDLQSNSATVDYTGASPLAGLAAAIKNGYAGGTQTGTGIISSTASANQVVGIVEASSVTLAGGSFLGTPVDGTTILIRTVNKGDSDLNGLVNFADLLSIAQNFGLSTTSTFRQGDSNYDGLVNFADLLSLAQNFNVPLSAGQEALLGSDFSHDWALAQSLAPEPVALSSLAFVSAIALRRRR